MYLDSRNVEWLNLNSQRSYPLAEGVTGFDTSGTVKLPNDFIVDMTWSVNTVGTISVDKFHIFSIAVFSTGVVIEFGYDGISVGITTIDKVTFTPDSSYNILGAGILKDSKGIVTIGSLDTLRETITGDVRFDLTGSRLVPTVIKRALKNVTGVYVRNSSEISSLYQGDVVLQSGLNVTFTATSVLDLTTITINAIPGEGEQPPGINEDESGNTINPLLTINGISPDAKGNFTLEGDTCIKFNELSAELEMLNDCSSPCCGCDDLDSINTELNAVRTQVDSMNLESGRLAAEIQSIAINLVTTKTDGPPTDVARMVAIMNALLTNADAAADCVPACPVPEPGDTLELEDGDDFELEDGDSLEF